MPPLQQPEAYVGSAGSLIDNEGNVTVDSTKQFLVSYGKAFADWIGKIAA
jgi:chromate reductase